MASDYPFDIFNFSLRAKHNNTLKQNDHLLILIFVQSIFILCRPD